VLAKLDIRIFIAIGKDNLLFEFIEIVSSGFDLRRFLSSEREQLQWKAEGLPSDDLSMENALIILQVCSRSFEPCFAGRINFSRTGFHRKRSVSAMSLRFSMLLRTGKYHDKLAFILCLAAKSRCVNL